MMNTKKILLTILLIGILIQTAAAAFTVTMNEPTADTVYNNTPANRKTIDINFTVVDNNGSVEDVNIELFYYEQNSVTTTEIVGLTDWNGLLTSNADMNCVKGLILQADSNWAAPGRDCTYRWTMPLDTVLRPGDYYIDANVLSYDRSAAGDTIYDQNATVAIIVDNSMSGSGTVRGLLQTMIVVIIAMAIAAIATVGAILKPEPAEYAKVSFMIAIIAIFASLVIGFILPLI